MRWQRYRVDHSIHNEYTTYRAISTVCCRTRASPRMCTKSAREAEAEAKAAKAAQERIRYAARLAAGGDTSAYVFIASHNKFEATSDPS